MSATASAASPRLSRRLSAWIDSVGVVGPGLPDWPRTAAILAGATAFEPTPPVLTLPAILPPAERRRTGVAVKVALICGHEAASRASRPVTSMVSVFASSGGDGDNCHAICEALASDDRLISPTRFHNSVHNAPAGYWSIAMATRAASTSLCAHDASFAAGLLEALTEIASRPEAVILVAYDAPYPEPLRSARAIPWPFGIALVLTPTAGPTTLGRIEAHLAEAPATESADPGLERLRTTIPTARGLPLLAALAGHEAGTVALDYLEPLRLVVDVTPADGVASTTIARSVPAAARPAGS